MKKEKKHKKAKKKHSSGDAAPAAVIHAPSMPQAARSSTRGRGGLDTPRRALAREVVERVADKRTVIVLEVLAEHGVVRFSQLAKLAGGVSQKVLTKALRQMESDGLVRRMARPVIPPHVEYQLTQLGEGLGQAFGGVWEWAEANGDAVKKARAEFRATSSAGRSDADPEPGVPGHRKTKE